MRAKLKKILILLFFLVFLIQVPFIYQRYKLSELSAEIEKLSSDRFQTEETAFNYYRGVIHVHTSLGGHSTGHFEELIKAAWATELDFVVMTEHTSEFFDTSALTLRGKYGKTLFVNGQEVDTKSGDRFLMVPGHADSFADARLETSEFVEKYKVQKRLILVTYPERLKSKDASFDGIEVFSLNTNAKSMNPLMFFFDAVWSWNSYSELLLTKHFVRPDYNLGIYDELTINKRITLFAGTDAHSNIGFFLLGDDAGNKVFYFKFDPYQKAFRLIKNYVLVEKDKEFNEEALVEVVRRGRLFVSVDLWADPVGFSFTADETKTMGDEVFLGEKPVQLKVISPLMARIVFFRNGNKISEFRGSEAVFETSEKGAYRVEIYLDSLGLTQMPWIISNPIYIR